MTIAAKLRLLWNQFQRPRGCAQHGGRAAARAVRRPPQLEILEDRVAPAATAIGASAGGPPVVKLLDDSGAVIRSVRAFGPSYEWHVDLAFFLNLGKLGSYPVSPL